nr:cobalamin B12-binding domain-containing protein [PVC group bacterium]
MSNKTDQNTSPFPNSSSYARDAVPPPGPFWEKLKGVENAKICLLSLYVIENSGIRLLAAILRKHGFRVHEIYFKDWYTNRIDPPTEKEIKALLQEIHKVDPDIIGMSVRASAFHRMATSITEQIRSELGIPI